VARNEPGDWVFKRCHIPGWLGVSSLRKGITTMNLRITITTAILLATTLPALAQGRSRQEDKNLMRNLGLGLGAAAVSEYRKGNTNKAALLGAGALLAGKKYEDQRRAQNWDRFDRRDDDDRDDRYSRNDRRDRDDRDDDRRENSRGRGREKSRRGGHGCR
jgi:hypothetical protein